MKDQLWATPICHVSWLIHTCGMTHSYVWHDSCMSATWFRCEPNLSCAVTRAYVWHDSYMSATWYKREQLQYAMRHDSFISITQHFYACDVIQVSATQIWKVTRVGARVRTRVRDRARSHKREGKKSVYTHVQRHTSQTHTHHEGMWHGFYIYSTAGAQFGVCKPSRGDSNERQPYLLCVLSKTKTVHYRWRSFWIYLCWSTLLRVLGGNLVMSTAAVALRI